jgi:hypothetical protein
MPNWGTHPAQPHAITAAKAATAAANASSPNARDRSDARSLESPRFIGTTLDANRRETTPQVTPPVIHLGSKPPAPTGPKAIAINLAPVIIVGPSPGLGVGGAYTQQNIDRLMRRKLRRTCSKTAGSTPTSFRGGRSGYPRSATGATIGVNRTPFAPVSGSITRISPAATATFGGNGQGSRMIISSHEPTITVEITN